VVCSRCAVWRFSGTGRPRLPRRVVDSYSDRTIPRSRRIGRTSSVGGAHLGKGRVQVVLREVVPAERPAELGQRALEALGAGDRVLNGAGLGISVRDDQADARHDQQLLGIAALGGRPGPQVGAERHRLLHRRRVREDRVGHGGAQVTPVLGVAGLEDDRLALRCALEIQRPDHRKVRALVVQGVLPLAVQEDPALLVPGERVRLVRVPETLGDLHVFQRTPVPGRVVEGACGHASAFLGSPSRGAGVFVGINRNRAAAIGPRVRGAGRSAATPPRTGESATMRSAAAAEVQPAAAREHHGGGLGHADNHQRTGVRMSNDGS
jgi:hypothetical protein